jgi:hypothetical protein
VLSKLDVRLRTPTPPGTPNGPQTPWVSKTPKTTSEALSQSTLIRSQIARHQGSSPIPILSAVDQLSKGMQSIFPPGDPFTSRGTDASGGQRSTFQTPQGQTDASP